MLVAYATLLATLSVVRSQVPSVTYLLMAAVALAVYKNVLGRFIRDWLLVFAGLFAYLATGHFSPVFDLPVHFKPQIAVDRALGFGTVPSVWLQEHLYHGRTGWLEIFTTLMYLSHFFAPLALGLLIWFSGRRRAFGELMFGILVTSILADITFVLLPTAPPWLAAEHGYLPPIHHIIRDGLVSLHLPSLAAMDGDATKYNIVAAVPSMHAAFPIIALLVVLRHRLPRWLVAAQAAQLAGVLFAIVYSGEHYVVDAVVGGAYAVVGCAIVRRGLDRVPRIARQPARLEGALGEPVAVRVTGERR